MMFERGMWAEATDRRKKAARRAFAGAAICSLAATGAGFVSAHFAKSSLDGFEYADKLEHSLVSPFTGGARVNSYLLTEAQKSRDSAYQNGGISLAAILATCALAAGAVRLYRRFINHFSDYREARSATRMFDRRGG